LNNTDNININLSINSGQYFLWEKMKNTWYGVYGENILKITEIENKKKDEIIYEFDSFPEYNNWQNYIFRKDDNYDEIIYEISKNKKIKNIIQKYPGLRILRQKPIQCIFSFLCSEQYFRIFSLIKLKRRPLNIVQVDICFTISGKIDEIS